MCDVFWGREDMQRAAAEKRERPRRWGGPRLLKLHRQRFRGGGAARTITAALIMTCVGVCATNSVCYKLRPDA